MIWFLAVLKFETWNTCETWKESKDDGKTDKSFITSDGTKASRNQEDKQQQQQQEKKHDEAEAESKGGASREQAEPEIVREPAVPNTKEIPISEETEQPAEAQVESAAQEQVAEDRNKTAAAEEADAEAETQL